MILGSQRDVQAWADCAAPKKSRFAFERLCMRVVNIRSFSNRAEHLTAIGDFSVVEAFFSGDLSGRRSGLFLSKASVFPCSRGTP